MPARKAIIAVTSKGLTLPQSEETVGIIITKVLHPYIDLVDAGFEVDLISETGSYTVTSSCIDLTRGEDLKIWNDVNSEFRKKLDNMPKASEVDGSQYGLFYASQSLPQVSDYETSSGLQKIALQIWVNGSVIAAVCDGAEPFINMIDPSTGKPITTRKIAIKAKYVMMNEAFAADPNGSHKGKSFTQYLPILSLC